MRTAIISLFVLLAHAACAADAITSSEEALSAFTAIMRKSIEQRTGKKAPADSKLDERTSASSSTSLEVHERVKDTLLPNQYASSVQAGTLGSLLPDRKVWVISHSVDVFSGFQAVLDAKDGKLIFLWWIPEG
ncbi:MAG: hypothetical protein K9N47_02280 [Prosthecobacter sp.]|uniref:hypothetical protein n=1 Tax=Prosthecobacter sp. TaxID=1965333 RepID=UPI0025D62422|nr:hypothetical protein [Prosthecobacter sp.]MCF7784916.1 hypothetical protein [Prosthecobacter sp.]